MDLTPLYNRRRALFHIGLDPDTGATSSSYYDLLMSESRLAGYFAIATRSIPKSTGAPWAALWPGREAMWVRCPGRAPCSNISCPVCCCPLRRGSMSYEALRFCLHCQKRRPTRGVPWGVSESGFYAFDSNLNYQYKAHGVPRLGLETGAGRRAGHFPLFHLPRSHHGSPGLPAQFIPAEKAGHDRPLRLLRGGGFHPRTHRPGATPWYAAIWPIM